VTGVDVLLASSMAGTIGQIGFIAGVDTAAEVDDVNAALAADATYLGTSVEAGDLLVTGSTDPVIAMQMDEATAEHISRLDASTEPANG